MIEAHKILHNNFIQFGSNAKEWTRKCALLLPEISKNRIWEQKGFGSIFEYAAKLAGMSRNSVEDALRILSRIEDKPELMKVVEVKGLNAVRPVVTIATQETAAFWAKKALEMAKNTLYTYAKEYRILQNKSRTSPESEQENIVQTMQLDEVKNYEREAKTEVTKKTIVMQLAPEILAELEKLKGQGDWNELMKQLLKIRAEKIESEKPRAVVATSRHIPAKIERNVVARTNGTCSFPGCNKPYKILHHTQRFALEKIHDPSRIEPLCVEHERIAHQGLVKNENLPAAQWVILKEADTKNPKFKIDLIVNKFRHSTA